MSKQKFKGKLPKTKLEVENSDRVNLILKKIQPQVLDIPEGRVLYSIVEKAICDSLAVKDSRSSFMEARKYLSAERVPHCEIAGVDTLWVHTLLVRYGFVDAWIASAPDKLGVVE